ncbi:MAG: winged helix-turn-helix domain-containing protein [Tepidisphaeraceae bacterium]
MASLFDRPHVGRPSKVTERYVTPLKAAVAKGPGDMGYAFTAWTLDRLREHLLRRTKVSLSPAHLSRLPHAHGIVYRRPKHGMAHLRDPHEYDQKKALLAFLKKGRRVATPALTCFTSTRVRFTSERRACPPHTRP